jgi:hypothetical protein
MEPKMGFSHLRGHRYTRDSPQRREEVPDAVGEHEGYHGVAARVREDGGDHPQLAREVLEEAAVTEDEELACARITADPVRNGPRARKEEAHGCRVRDAGAPSMA